MNVTRYIIILVTLIIMAPAAADDEIKVRTAGGTEKIASFGDNEIVYYSLSELNQILGGRVRWRRPGYSVIYTLDTNRFLLTVGSPYVKINWDLYHMHITEGDLCGHMKEGFDAGQIGYLQLADHPGRNEPGTGEIHYNRVLKEAWDLGYRDYVGLECRPQTDEVTAAKRVAAADIW